MDTKVCNNCGIEQFTDAFHKNKQSQDGLCFYCKICVRQRSKRYYKTNAVQVQQRVKDRYHKSKIDDVYMIKKRQRGLKWFYQNKDKHCANMARRRAAKRNQTPAWSKNDHRIATLYALAAKLREAGLDVYVDHIIPLQPSDPNHAVGLHVFENLRIITAKENLSKGNR
jgi:hypothetical protein